MDFNPQNNADTQAQPNQAEQEQKGFSIQDTIGQTVGNIDLGKVATQGTSKTRSGKTGKSEVEKIASSAANTVAREVSRQLIRGIFGQLKL